MITVRYFAAAQERAGIAREELDIATGTTVAALRLVLSAKHPALESVLRQSRLALDQRFANNADVVVDGCEVAVIPPVAGG